MFIQNRTCNCPPSPSVPILLYFIFKALGNKVWESLKAKEPKEVLTMVANEKGFDLSNTEATGRIGLVTE